MQGTWLIATVFGFTSFAFSSNARAHEPSERDLRQAMELFADGLRLLRQRDWAAGCARFEASAELVPRPSSLAKIGICHRHERRYVDAWAALQRARELNDLDPRTRRPQLEEELQTELALIPVLRLEVPEPPAELSVRLDGVELPRESWTRARPLELGKHQITAVAPNHEPLTVAFACEDEQPRTIRLRLVPQAPNTPAPRSVVATTEPAPPTGASPAKPAAAPSTQRSAGLVLAGLGGTGVLAAGVLGILTLARVDDSSSHCGYSAGSCDDTGVAMRNNARKLQTAGIVVAGISALAVGAGAYLYFSAPKPAAAGQARLGLALLPASLAVAGSVTW